ncbi:MAG TPA: SagB family peptide dehydrogenase [Streptosporangiaceae bacterium]|nr:SagB family peptide dehydrogenase [Streptosporangiaceae bacterium]
MARGSLAPAGIETTMPKAVAAPPPPGTLAERYWRETLFDLAGVSGDTPRTGPAGYPAPVTLYPGRALAALPTPGPLGTLADAFANAPQAGVGTPLPRPSLSTLLFYTYGYGHALLDAGSPHGALSPHRVPASARRMYPTELYVWVPPEPGVAGAGPGLHYYDPVHHGLVTVRPDACPPDLERALGASLAGAACVLVITSRFWKAAYRYADYAYRLCTQEAGLLAGHALLAAAALGLRGHVRYCFDDEAVSELLAADPQEESPMAVLPLWPAAQVPPPGANVTAPGAGVARPARRSTGEAGPGPGSEPFLALDAAARQCPAGVLPPAARAAGVPVEVPADVALPERSLADVLLRRSSGPVSHFAPVAADMPAEAFWLLCRYGPDQPMCDVVEPGGRPVAVMAAVNRVAGVDQGVYHLRPGASIFRITHGSVAAALTAAALNPATMNFRSTPLVVSVVADPAAGSRALGERGYRVMNIAAGVTAARVCVLAAASGLAARIHNTYRATAVAELLGFSGHPGPVPLFQIAVGRVGVRPALTVGL